jgi:hypothetical protein
LVLWARLSELGDDMPVQADLANVVAAQFPARREVRHSAILSFDGLRVDSNGISNRLPPSTTTITT